MQQQSYFFTTFETRSNYTMIEFKERLIDTCRKILSEKIKILSMAMQEIVESMNSETKSSLGDKHETARAKMQIEQEKIGKQLMVLEIQKSELERIDASILASKISFGSIADTNAGSFFISVPLGKIEFEQKQIYVISLSSPIGQKMYGLLEEQEFEYNQSKYTIHRIY